MPLYRIADFVWDIEARYDTVPRVCAPYEVKEGKADFYIRVSDEMLREETARTEEGFSASYIESICVCRALCDKASEHGAMLLHAATVVVNGEAYAFSAPSGTGKSTHIALWRRYCDGSLTVLNGDKPIVREKDGVLYAYGTPWCGKEGLNTNASAPLRGLCFLERAESNDIRPLPAEEALSRIFRQLLKPASREGVAHILRLSDALMRSVPLYLLSCNISEEAARLSFDTMTKRK